MGTSIYIWGKETVLDRFDGYDYVAVDTHEEWVSKKIAVDFATAKKYNCFESLVMAFKTAADIQDAAFEEDYYLPQAAKLAAYCQQRLTMDNYKDILNDVFKYTALFEEVRKRLAAEAAKAAKEAAEYEAAEKEKAASFAAKKAAAMGGLKKLSALLWADYNEADYLFHSMFATDVANTGNVGKNFFFADLKTNKKDNGKSLICFKDRKFTKIVNDCCLIPVIKFTGIEAAELCGEKRAAAGSKCLLKVLKTFNNSFVAQIVAICA